MYLYSIFQNKGYKELYRKKKGGHGEIERRQYRRSGEIGIHKILKKLENQEKVKGIK